MAYAFTPSTALRHMRNQHSKLTKGHSTKSERRFMEILKKLHIPFRTKVMIAGHEVDFVIGDVVIEVDGHAQDPFKNRVLIQAGYSPVHYNSWEIPNHNLEEWLKTIWQAQVSRRDTQQFQDCSQS